MENKKEILVVYCNRKWNFGELSDYKDFNCILVQKKSKLNFLFSLKVG